MPRLSPPPSAALTRFSFIVGGVAVPCFPAGPATLTGAPGQTAEAAPLFFRDTISGPLVFSGDDYALMLEIENSSTPCLPIGLLLELRPDEHAPFAHYWQGVFTCREQGSSWNLDHGTFSVTPATDDAYRLLLENWEQEYNLLDLVPDNGLSARQQVTAELATLAAGTSLEFLRIDATAQADYVGQDGWEIFLTNTSFISGSSGALGVPNPDSTRSRDIILFRYRLQRVPMYLVPGGTYTALDKSDRGWQLLIGSESSGAVPHTVDYVKAPTISGFKPFKIGTYNDWNDPQNSGRTNRYGNQLLLLPCFQSPADYGFRTADYLKVTGTGGAGGGPSMGGAFNAEADGGQCLNVRRRITQGSTDPANSKSLWFRFGQFKFGRCFPLTEAIRQLLRGTAAPIIGGIAQPSIPGIAVLVPPTNTALSTFYTADTNPATGATGTDNEIPRLLLSAASDVKRYGDSEPATRLMISLKQLVDDLSALHDTSWFIDPATGWFRMEHRAYAETRYQTGPVSDLRAIANAILPRVYSTRQAQMPRYEELAIANATTTQGAQVSTGVYETDFARGSIDYGIGSCANGREGQNKSTRAVSRLSGDVAAMVLGGDSVPDNALAILAPDANHTLADANQALAASRLLQRYHRRGRAARTASVNGQPLIMDSVRPAREQQDQSVPLSASLILSETAQFTTRLGSGGQLAKRVLNTRTGSVSLTLWLPVPDSTTPPHLPTGRQFDKSFSGSFD